MKNKLLVLLVAFLFVGTASFGQFTFSVNPGLNFNKASFGYKVADKFVPFIGIGYMGLNMTQEEHDLDWDGTDVVTDDTEMNLKGHVFIPNFGVKFFALEKNNLKLYAQLNVAIPMIKAEMEFDGETIDEVTDQTDAIKAWAGEFGIGVEYFFDENFSIGGEFGLRTMNGTYDYSYDDTVWNGTEDQTFDHTILVKPKISPTYSLLSLNFYF